MADPIITNVNVGNVIIGAVNNADGLLTFAGANTVIAGTILAVDSVSLKYVPFVKGGATNENGIPKAVISYAVTSAGAGDVTVRPIISGEVQTERLVIDADGDASNVDLAVTDGLRDFSIVAISATELNIQDNQ